MLHGFSIGHSGQRSKRTIEFTFHCQQQIQAFGSRLKIEFIIQIFEFLHAKLDQGAGSFFVDRHGPRRAGS